MCREKSRNARKIVSLILMLKSSCGGRLLACIASRPDQCGRDNGYILEGEKDIKKGKKTTKQAGRLKLAYHLEQTPQKDMGVERQELGMARQY
ncbi:hypothetical protein Ahy_A07g034501 isoform A [Arachis hypogaea]|uniref:Uncharacterized protein n=1 Tax=Arachis hypogaea TaxID=3818 RepID=A0A445CC20_ARAHY|nr:hypothetical protein Ahy_A07g034501 isoform A [Arachis hypogaea]